MQLRKGTIVINEVFRKYWGTATLAFAIVIALYQAFFINNQLIQHADNACVMDSMRLLLAGRNCSIVIILVVVWYMYITKDDYDTMLILRMKNKKNLWRAQCKKILKVSFVITLYIIIIGFTIGLITSKNWLNWSLQSSFYSSGTSPKGIYLTSNISVVQILLLTFIFLYFQIAISLCLVVLGYWSINSYIVPLIVIVAVAISDAFTSFEVIFYRRFTITSNDWSTLGPQLWIKLFILFAIFSAMVYLGTLIANRKEFIGDEKM